MLIGSRLGASFYQQNKPGQWCVRAGLKSIQQFLAKRFTGLLVIDPVSQLCSQSRFVFCHDPTQDFAVGYFQQANHLDRPLIYRRESRIDGSPGFVV